MEQSYDAMSFCYYSFRQRLSTATLLFAAVVVCIGSYTSEVHGYTPTEATFALLQNDTVNAPRMVKRDRNGALRLTAENGKGIGPKIEYMPEWRAFGWFTGNDVVEWEVKVPKTGSYDVFLEWSVSDKEAGKEFVFQAREADLQGTVRSTGSWEKFETLHIGTVRLTAGKQTMVFRSKAKFDIGALLDLREVRLVPAK